MYKVACSLKWMEFCKSMSYGSKMTQSLYFGRGELYFQIFYFFSRYFRIDCVIEPWENHPILSFFWAFKFNFYCLFFRFWNVNAILQTFWTVHRVHPRTFYDQPTSLTVLRPFFCVHGQLLMDKLFYLQTRFINSFFGQVLGTYLERKR